MLFVCLLKTVLSFSKQRMKCHFKRRNPEIDIERDYNNTKWSSAEERIFLQVEKKTKHKNRPMLLEFIIFACVVYLLLILRPGSSWWVERALLRGGCVRAPILQIPLYGAVTGFDFSYETMFKEPLEDEAPIFCNVMGNITVITRRSVVCVKVDRCGSNTEGSQCKAKH